jgi:hypothetical protein
MRTVRALVPFEATTALRGRYDSVMASPTVRSERGTAREVGIHGTELQLCGAGARRREVQLAASREVVASREACDARNAPESQRLKWATV